MWRCVERGDVSRDHAQFVADGLRDGFTCGIDVSRLKGQKVFKNYKSAIDARPSVTRAVMKRVQARKTLCLGEWNAASRSELCDRFDTFSKFPMGAVPKFLDGVQLPEWRPTDDHTVTLTNDATVLDFLRHVLRTYEELAHFLDSGYFLRVSDVDNAFPLLPLHPDIWPFFFFSFWADDAHTHESLFVHLTGDFGTRGMPGTFKIFFVDVLVQMARSEGVLRLPMAVYVDDLGVVGPDAEVTDAEMDAFQAFGEAFGVTFKKTKDKFAAQRQLMLGFVWDTTTFTRTLEEHKLESYISLLLEYAGRPSLSLAELQSVAGKVQRAVMTMPPGASVLMANMFAMTHGLSQPWQRRRTNRAVREDFRQCAELLQLNLGRGYYRTDHLPEAPVVLSDASKSRGYTGGGFVSSCGAYSFWRYGTSAARKPIDYLEGDTVVRTVELLKAGWRGCIVPFGVDNSAFQGSQVKGWSHAQRLQGLLHTLFREQLEADFILRCFWLSTHDNVLADHLSRGREAEFLHAVHACSFLLDGVRLNRHADAGSVRCIGKHHSASTDGDGPSGIGRGIAQLLSVSYPRASLYANLTPEYRARLLELMDQRLSSSSQRTIRSAVRKWESFADAMGYAHVIDADDPERGSKLASFVMFLMDDTDLKWASIANYVWGVRMHFTSAAQPDPVMGVAGWTDFMKACMVAAWTPGEPRRAVPLETLRKALELVDLDDFVEVQHALFVVVLLFTFSRSECPCPKAFTGENAFDEKKHWQVRDFSVRVLDAVSALGVRMKAVKQDPRVERPEARGGEDWVYLGDAKDSVFSVFTWYRRVQAFHGGPREPTAPFFVARDRVRAYTYGAAMSDFRAFLGKVAACTPEDYGLHSLRVLGYNLSCEAVGEDLTVAHGGWKSSAHKRYARFAMSRVLSMPSAMVGVAPAEPAAPAPETMQREAPSPRQAPGLDAFDDLDSGYDSDEHLAEGVDDESGLTTSAAEQSEGVQPEGGLQFVPLAALGGRAQTAATSPAQTRSRSRAT